MALFFDDTYKFVRKKAAIIDDGILYLKKDNCLYFVDESRQATIFKCMIYLHGPCHLQKVNDFIVMYSEFVDYNREISQITSTMPYGLVMNPKNGELISKFQTKPKYGRSYLFAHFETCILACLVKHPQKGFVIYDLIQQKKISSCILGNIVDCYNGGHCRRVVPIKNCSWLVEVLRINGKNEDIHIFHTSSNTFEIIQKKFWLTKTISSEGYLTHIKRSSFSDDARLKIYDLFTKQTKTYKLPVDEGLRLDKCCMISTTKVLLLYENPPLKKLLDRRDMHNEEITEDNIRSSYKHLCYYLDLNTNHLSFCDSILLENKIYKLHTWFCGSSMDLSMFQVTEHKAAFIKDLFASIKEQSAQIGTFLVSEDMARNLYKSKKTILLH
jgi:hypothetical protein